MEVNEIKYEGKSYKFKYTLEKYDSFDKKGIFGNKQIIKEQDTLDGFLEEVLKDTNFVYVILYPCTKGSLNFDTYTGRWSFKIGEFKHELKEKINNKDIVRELKTIIEVFENIKKDIQLLDL